MYQNTNIPIIIVITKANFKSKPKKIRDFQQSIQNDIDFKDVIPVLAIKNQMNVRFGFEELLKLTLKQVYGRNGYACLNSIQSQIKDLNKALIQKANIIMEKSIEEINASITQEMNLNSMLQRLLCLIENITLEFSKFDNSLNCYIQDIQKTLQSFIMQHSMSKIDEHLSKIFIIMYKMIKAYSDYSLPHEYETEWKIQAIEEIRQSITPSSPFIGLKYIASHICSSFITIISNYPSYK